MNGLNTKTIINRPIAIKDLVKRYKFGKEEKEETEKHIATLTLTHAINSESTGLQANSDIGLIFVYRLDLTASVVPYKFVKALDSKTNAHTIFEIIDNNGQYTYTLASKTFSDKGITIGDYAGRVTTGEYAPPQDYPLVDIGGIYMLATAFVLDLTLKNDIIDVGCLWLRKERIGKIEREIAKITRELNATKQPKEKLEAHTKIKELQDLIAKEQ